MDLSKCDITPSGNIVTPQGRLSYAQYATEPKKEDNGTTKYSCSILIPGDSDLSVLKQEMGKIAMSKLDGDKAAAKAAVEKRFLDPNNLPGGGKPAGEEFKGWLLLRMSSKYKPDLVYPNGKPIPVAEGATECYSGRWARVSVNPYWFDTGSNKGVTCGLQNIQLLEHGENLGGGKPRGEGEFEAVSDEGGYSGSSEPDDVSEDIDDIFN